MKPTNREHLEPHAGAVLLSAGAAAQIRAALLDALELHGGGIEPEDDPDLTPGLPEPQTELERQPRAAIRTLHEAIART